MKRYRCPHCGWKTISYSDIYASYGTYRRAVFGRRVKSYAVCSQCGEHCTTVTVSKRGCLIKCVGFLLVIITGILGAIYRNIFLCLLAITVVFIDMLISPVKSLKRIKKVQSVYEPSGFDESPDGKFSVNDSRDIRSYGIYGIKFDCEKYDETLRKLYIDGMVPVAFHEKKKGSNMFEVRIIGKKFVPKELLQPGSKFMVEDNDQFICRGQVEEIFPKCAESDEQTD